MSVVCGWLCEAPNVPMISITANSRIRPTQTKKCRREPTVLLVATHPLTVGGQSSACHRPRAAARPTPAVERTWLLPDAVRAWGWGLPLRTAAVAVAASVAVAACSSGDDQADPPSAAPTVITVTSTAFDEGGPIPKDYTCDGAETSPPLAWTGVPTDASALALVVDDPDAPGGTFVHWAVVDIGPGTDEVQAGGTPTAGVQLENSSGDASYAGPCPPSGTHHYRFTVYALSKPLEVATGATARRRVRGHRRGVTRPGDADGHLHTSVTAFARKGVATGSCPATGRPETVQVGCQGVRVKTWSAAARRPARLLPGGAPVAAARRADRRGVLLGAGPGDCWSVRPDGSAGLVLPFRRSQSPRGRRGARHDDRLADRAHRSEQHRHPCQRLLRVDCSGRRGLDMFDPRRPSTPVPGTATQSGRAAPGDAYYAVAREGSRRSTTLSWLRPIGPKGVVFADDPPVALVLHVKPRDHAPRRRDRRAARPVSRPAQLAEWRRASRCVTRSVSRRFR